MCAEIISSFKGSVVVIDDEDHMCTAVTRILNQNGYHVTSFTDTKKALEYIARYEPDVVLTDIRMPDMSGMEVLKESQKISTNIAVIMMTAYGTIEEAIESMKEGAYHYITKPVQFSELLINLSKAIEHKRLKEDNLNFAKHIQREYLNIELIGNTPSIEQIKQLIRKIAPTDSAVLIRGESGTGKELVARAIHKNSRRNDKRFVPINCASIPENLIESELFGYEKGAFTGANQTKQGLIEVAHGGTLFLDEIGDLPLTLQAKLLRVLQEREIQRVGGLKQIPVDIRLLAATNKDLQQAIENSEFRKDLFYRLNVITINLPPLSERIDDIEVLAYHFIEKIAAKLNKGKINVDERVFPILKAYSWPGNIRELENIIERVIVLLDGDIITVEDLPDDIIRSRISDAGTDLLPYDKMLTLEQRTNLSDKDYWGAKDDFEKDYIRSLLLKTKGSVTEASKISGMSRRNLYDKMEKFNIKPDDYKD